MIDGKPRLRTVTATTIAEAREQRELVAAAALRGELPVFPRLTFAEAAARWLQLYERRVALGERRERTLENSWGSETLSVSAGSVHQRDPAADSVSPGYQAVISRDLSAARQTN